MREALIDEYDRAQHRRIYRKAVELFVLDELYHELYGEVARHARRDHAHEQACYGDADGARLDSRPRGTPRR